MDHQRGFLIVPTTSSPPATDLATFIVARQSTDLLARAPNLAALSVTCNLRNDLTGLVNDKRASIRLSPVAYINECVIAEYQIEMESRLAER